MSDQKNAGQNEDGKRDSAEIRERVQRLVKETSKLNNSLDEVEQNLEEARREVPTFDEQV
ncbi:MAG: hypothetical protein M3N48_08465 [Verrucomicrobiota bacterium]|nr:hypothetical protein [Verrucomicrobiota bacterium]